MLSFAAALCKPRNPHSTKIANSTPNATRLMRNPPSFSLELVHHISLTDNLFPPTEPPQNCASHNPLSGTLQVSPPHSTARFRGMTSKPPRL
jgi:hypothetical protein